MTISFSTVTDWRELVSLCNRFLNMGQCTIPVNTEQSVAPEKNNQTFLRLLVWDGSEFEKHSLVQVLMVFMLSALTGKKWPKHKGPINPAVNASSAWWSVKPANQPRRAGLVQLNPKKSCGLWTTRRSSSTRST